MQLRRKGCFSRGVHSIQLEECERHSGCCHRQIDRAQRSETTDHVNCFILSARLLSKIQNTSRLAFRDAARQEVRLTQSMDRTKSPASLQQFFSTFDFEDLLASNGALSSTFCCIQPKPCTDKRITEVLRHLVAPIIFGAGSNDALAFAGEKSADREYWEEIVDRRGFATPLHLAPKGIIR